MTRSRRVRSRSGDRRVGARPLRWVGGRVLQVALAGAAGGAVLLVAGAERIGAVVLLAAAAWLARDVLARRRAAARLVAAQTEAAPAVVDLLAACLRAGLNGHLALVRVAERCPAPLETELELVVAALRLGRTPAAALRAAAERTGLAELRAAAGALEAAERWGAPPAEALTARAAALRTRLHLQAEAAAGRAAVRLTFPLVLCFLPAFILLTVVPLIAGALQSITRQ